MDEFSSRRKSSDGRQDHIFFTGSLQVMDLFRVLFKETIRRLQVMVKGMDHLSILIKENIMRLQVMVQVMALFSVLIKETIMRLQVMDLLRVFIQDTEF